MKIMLVALASVLAASGCACFTPDRDRADSRYGYNQNDYRTNTAGQFDGDRNHSATNSGYAPATTGLESDYERSQNAGRIGYDNYETNGVTTGGTPYRSNGTFGSTTNSTWGQSADADTRSTNAIRTRIAGSQLSTNARNATITTENGRVTLRGRVDSEQERETIARIARDIAGESNVNDNLEVVMAR